MHTIEHREPSNSELVVRSHDVTQLGEIHELLLAFNDPQASSYKLTKHVANIPVLKARCIYRAYHCSGRRKLSSLEQVMTLIGNRGLGDELLLMLEDMTFVKADLQEGKHVERDYEPRLARMSR